MSDDLFFFNVVNNNHMLLKKFDTLSSLLQSICSLLIFLFVSWSKVMILLVIPKYVGLSGANYAKNLLRATVLLQYVPRIIRFVPLLDGQSANGFIFESAWANFVINLLMFVLAGHVVGSCWYLFGFQVSQVFFYWGGVQSLVVHNFDSNVPIWIIIPTILFTTKEYAFYKYFMEQFERHLKFLLIVHDLINVEFKGGKYAVLNTHLS